jgi:hypothetical protein
MTVQIWLINFKFTVLPKYFQKENCLILHNIITTVLFSLLIFESLENTAFDHIVEYIHKGSTPFGYI